MTTWARRLPRRSVRVECGGVEHTVLLHRGKVVLVDHDRAGEAALQALGGDEPACVEALRQWRQRSIRSGPVGLPAALEEARAWTLCRTAERRRRRGASDGTYLERRVREEALAALERWSSAARESGRQPLTFGCRLEWGDGDADVISRRVGGNLHVEVVLPSSWWCDVGIRGALADERLVFRLSSDLGLRWRSGRPQLERYVS